MLGQGGGQWQEGATDRGPSHPCGGGQWQAAPTPLKADSQALILRLVHQRGVHTLLELGGALGESATRLAAAGVRVTTVEREPHRAAAIGDLASRCGVADRVRVVCADALSPSLCIALTFDLILIDAAKSQYIRLFQRYQHQLAPGGIIVSDNMAFHGMVADPSLTQSRSTKRLARHLREYADYLRWHPDFVTRFCDVGDGLAVSERKGDFGAIVRKERLLFSAGDVRYFALEQGGSPCALKVLPAGTGEADARDQARLLAAVHSSYPASLAPVGLVRVGELFALMVSPPPLMSLPCALRLAAGDEERRDLVARLAALQRAIAPAGSARLASYKGALRQAAGGDTPQAAPIIRAIKRLPEGEHSVVLCDTLDELVVLEGGTVCFAGAGSLCRAPFEALVCATWLLLSPLVSPAVTHSYLDSAGVSEAQIAPFARVFQMLPTATH